MASKLNQIDLSKKIKPFVNQFAFRNNGKQLYATITGFYSSH